MTAVVDQAEGGQVVCGAEAGSCICGLPPGHTGRVHECRRAGCGGQWAGRIDQSDFVIVRLPVPVAVVTRPHSPQRVMADELPGAEQERWEAAGRQLAALAEHGYAVVSTIEPDPEPDQETP